MLVFEVYGVYRKEKGKKKKSNMEMTHHLALVAGCFSSWDWISNKIDIMVLVELGLGRKDWQESFFYLQQQQKNKPKIP